jgi:PAS domain S-box-containing protein
MTKLKPSYIELERRVQILQKQLHQFKCSILDEDRRKNMFLDDLLEGCQIIGFDWRYIYINDSASQHNKRPKEEFLGRKYTEVWPGIEKTQVFHKIKDCLENRNWHQMENKFIFPDGSLGWFDLSIQPVPEGVFILSIDITAKKKIEKEISANVEKFKIIFESSNVGKSITLLTGEIEANQAFCDMLGYSKQELQNKKWQELTPSEDIEGIERNLAAIISGQKDADRFIKRYFHRNGSIVLVDLSLVLYRNEQGEPLFFISTLIDVTERKQIERKLEHNRRMMKTLLGNLPGMAYRCVNSKDWKMKFMSEGCKALTGYDPKELIGNKNINYNDLIYPGDQKRIWSDVQQAIRENRVFEIEYRIITKDDKLKWVWERGKMVGENGRQEILEGFITDITERKHASEALRLNEKRLNNAQFMAGMGDFTWELESGKITWSDSLYNLLGYEKDDDIDFDLVNEKIHHPEDLELINQWLSDCIYSGGNILTPNEYRLIRKDKQIIYVRTQGIIERSDNHATMVFASILDITGRKQAEQKIQKMNQELELRVQERTSQLERSNKELQTFTYSVSHDLKAPLRCIDGYSRLLQELYENKLDEEGQGFIRNIREGSMQMNELIEDLLAYSRLERNALKITQIPLQDFIENVSLPYQGEIEKREIVLETHLSISFINTDQDSLAMAVRNLIENAIKFSKKDEKTKIIIGADEKPDSWIMYVQDNGIGFNMEYHKKIFEIFQRLHRVEEYPGTGIGLALVAKAMQRIGGKAWAKGRLNEGSTFYLEIPKN